MSIAVGAPTVGAHAWRCATGRGRRRPASAAHGARPSGAAGPSWHIAPSGEREREREREEGKVGADTAEVTSAGAEASRSGRRRIEKGNCVEVEAEAGYIFGLVDSDEKPEKLKERKEEARESHEKR